MSKSKGGLGKGLSALIRPADEADASPLAAGVQPPRQGRDGEIADIETSRIRPNPYQPRADFDQQALDELKESIRQKGIIQPVTVRRTSDGMYELISGERRIRASAEIGLLTVPAYIIEVKNNEEMLELALIENLQREHLNPIEIAISYQRLIHDVGMTAEDVARKVSKDRTTVVNFLRLLKLPAKIQDALRKSQLTMGHARALVALPDEHTQMKVFDRIVRRDLNVRQVEALVRNLGRKAEKKPASLPSGSASAVRSLAERMQQTLATRVKIDLREGGRGEIIIEFYSNDDLERLYDLITSVEQ